MLPLFLFEAVRAVGRPRRRCATPEGAARAGRLAAALRRARSPSAALALAAYNYARFQNPFEFGHQFLHVQWQERMFRFGLFNYHFLSRNLAAALVLLPRIMTH